MNGAIIVEGSLRLTVNLYEKSEKSSPRISSFVVSSFIHSYVDRYTRRTND